MTALGPVPGRSPTLESIDSTVLVAATSSTATSNRRRSSTRRGYGEPRLARVLRPGRLSSRIRARRGNSPPTLLIGRQPSPALVRPSDLWAYYDLSPTLFSE